jgi:TPR repeat protein
MLAAFYMDGLGGLAKNDQEAARLLKLAADQDLPVAQRMLGTLYESGRGVPQDVAHAKEWYRRAAALGDADASTKLADLEDESSPTGPAEKINLMCQGSKGKTFVLVDTGLKSVVLEGGMTIKFEDGDKQYVRITRNNIEFGCRNSKSEGEVLAKGFGWMLGDKTGGGFLSDAVCFTGVRLITE